MPEKKRPQEFERSSIAFKHRLYKLELANFKRNTSWKHLEPSIQEIEHCHFHHSVKKNGQPQDRSTPVGGHFHKITIDWTKAVEKEITLPDGTKEKYEGPAFTCSAPMRMVTIKRGRREFKKEMPVEFETMTDDGDMTKIVDTHTHFIRYLGTETIDPETQRRAQDRDRAQLAPLVDFTKAATQPIAEQQVQHGTFKAGSDDASV